MENLINHKSAFVRHCGYFLGAIPLVPVTIIALIITIICSIIWFFIEKDSFTLTWKEFFKLQRKLWFEK